MYNIFRRKIVLIVEETNVRILPVNLENLQSILWLKSQRIN